MLPPAHRYGFGWCRDDVAVVRNCIFPPFPPSIVDYRPSPLCTPRCQVTSKYRQVTLRSKLGGEWPVGNQHEKDGELWPAQTGKAHWQAPPAAEAAGIMYHRSRTGMRKVVFTLFFPSPLPALFLLFFFSSSSSFLSAFCLSLLWIIPLVKSILF